LIKEQFELPTYIPHYGDSAVINGREFSIEGTTVTLVDPKVQMMHDYLEQLESDYLELRKRLEHIAPDGDGKLPEILDGMDKARKIIRKTTEFIANGK